MTSSPAFPRFMALAAIAALGLACKKTASKAPSELVASLEADGSVETVHVEVTTAPGAEVEVAVNFAVLASGVADAKGKYVADVEVPPQKPVPDQPPVNEYTVAARLQIDGKPGSSLTQRLARPLRLEPVEGALARCIGSKADSDHRCRIEANGPGHLAISAPDGTRVTVGKVDTELAGGSNDVALPAEVMDKLLDLKIGNDTKEKASVPIKLRFPDGAKVSGTVKVSSEPLRRAFLAAIAAGPGTPALFGSEGASERRKGLVYSRSLKPDPRGLTAFFDQVLGSASTFRDLDLLAADDPLVKSVNCGTYASANGKVKANATATLITSRIEVWDRRTGKSLGKRTFPPTGNPCGETANGAALGGASAGSKAGDSAAVRTWLTSFLKG